MKNNYTLIDCGLIHKYLVKKEDIEIIEDETFFTVEVVKDLSSYKVENKLDRLVLSNGSETLIFIKADSKDGIFKYFLDEFKSCETKEVMESNPLMSYVINKNLTGMSDLKISERRLEKLLKGEMKPTPYEYAIMTQFTREHSNIVFKQKWEAWLKKKTAMYI